MTTTAEYLASHLASRGVARIFGMPGGESTEVMAALRAVGVPFVLMHHEAAAGFAADAVGFLTGQPGVALSTLGPGAVNLLSGVAGAWLERAPVLALTADIEPSAKAATTHQHLPLAGLFGPVSKASHVLTAENAAAVVPGAYDLMTDGLPGPVHLALSRAEARRQAIEAEPIPLQRRQLAPPDLRQVIRGLQKARRPVVAVGIGMAHANADAALRRLVEAWGVPVVVTPKAKGHLPEDHPFYVGVYGVYGWRPVGELLAQADAVLAVGLEGIDFIPSWDYEAPVYSLSPGYGPDPTYPQTELVEGDLCELLDQLAESPPPLVAWTADEVRGYRSRILDLLAPRPETAFAPQHVIAALNRVLPEDAIATCDVGSHKLLMAQQWVARRGRTFLIANGLSAMGYGVASAFGARCVYPDRPVATLIGDGGFLMYTGELETLRRTNARVMVVVLVDSTLALIRNQQQKVGADPYGVDFGLPDYAAVGRAFGLATWEVDRPDDCEGVLRAALAHDGPSLVVAAIDPAEYRRF